MDCCVARRTEKLIHDHRMPVFKLTDDERRQLALFLAGESVTAPIKSSAPPDASLIAEGRALVIATHCANCHHLPYLTETKNIPTLEKEVVDWSKSCVAGEPDRKTGRPKYTLSKDDTEAVTAFVKSRHVPLTVESEFTHRATATAGRRIVLRVTNATARAGIAAIAGAMANHDSSTGAKRRDDSSRSDRRRRQAARQGAGGRRSAANNRDCGCRGFACACRGSSILLRKKRPCWRISSGTTAFPIIRALRSRHLLTMRPNRSRQTKRPSNARSGSRIEKSTATPDSNSSEQGAELLGLPQGRPVRAAQRRAGNARQRPVSARRPHAPRILPPLDAFAATHHPRHGDAVVRKTGPPITRRQDRHATRRPVGCAQRRGFDDPRRRHDSRTSRDRHPGEPAKIIRDVFNIGAPGQPESSFPRSQWGSTMVTTSSLISTAWPSSPAG